MISITRWAFVFSAAWLTVFSVHATSPFSRAECEKPISEENANAIIREVFNVKVERLAAEKMLPPGFWGANKTLEFAICNNRASYDTFLVYGRGVVFDYHMVLFLFAQARALMLGRYIADGLHQFDVHEDLVEQFVAQGASLKDGPFAIIEKKARALGKTDDFLKQTLADPEFNKREQTFFLQALYFLSMHERCHAALNHSTALKQLEGLAPEVAIAKRQELELDADRCAMSIINADEARSASSPISYFGALMVIATQEIVANHPKLRTDRSHPSTRRRLAAANKLALDFVAKSQAPSAADYAATVTGTTKYFDGLLQRLETAR